MLFRRQVTFGPKHLAEIKEAERLRACDIVATNMKHGLGCGFDAGYHCECMRGWILAAIRYGDGGVSHERA